MITYRKSGRKLYWNSIPSCKYTWELQRIHMKSQQKHFYRNQSNRYFPLLWTQSQDKYNFYLMIIIIEPYTIIIRLQLITMQPGRTKFMYFIFKNTIKTISQNKLWYHQFIICEKYWIIRRAQQNKKTCIINYCISLLFHEAPDVVL